MPNITTTYGLIFALMALTILGQLGLLLWVLTEVRELTTLIK